MHNVKVKTLQNLKLYELFKISLGFFKMFSLHFLMYVLKYKWEIPNLRF